MLQRLTTSWVDGGALAGVLLLALSPLLLAGACQRTVAHDLGGGAGTPRMGYESMPFLLLLSPLSWRVARGPGTPQQQDPGAG